MSKIKYCECGCSVRGLTQFTIEGYKKVYGKQTFETYDQKIKKNKFVTTDLYLDNNKHVFNFDLGFYDFKIQKNEIIKKAKTLIKEFKKSHPEVDFFEVWALEDVQLTIKRKD